MLSIRPLFGFAAVSMLLFAAGCDGDGSGGGGSTSGGSGGSGTSTSGGSGGAGAVGSGGVAQGGSSSGGAGGTTTGTGGGPTGPGMFVAVGYGGRRARSTDGAQSFVDDQSLMPNGGDDMALLRTVVAGPDQIVALGWRVMLSNDAVAWTDQGTIIGNWVGAAVYAKGHYFAVGGYGLRAESADGVTWNNHSIDTAATHAHDGLVFGDIQGGRLASANDSGKRAWSADGITWSFASGADAVKTSHLAFGNGTFVGIGGAEVVTSTDGATWKSSAKLSAEAGGIVFAEGHFTALADGHVFTSPDGATWTDHDAPGVSAGGIVYGDGVYVTLGWQSFRRSTDGVTWEPWKSTGNDNSFEWITFVPSP